MIDSPQEIYRVIEEELKKQRQNRLAHVQNLNQRAQVRSCADLRITINGETVPNEDLLGTRQVESLLSFIVEDKMERALGEAELDNRTYEGLGEHRILGRAKKKKKKPSQKNTWHY